jgi:lipopolysaccharide transport system permease protein
VDSTIETRHQGSIASPLGSQPESSVDDLPVTVIERRPGWQVIGIAELCRYRDLFLVLSWRDIQVRYKQTVLGIAWAILQPLSITIVLSIFFSGLIELRSGPVPYDLFVFVGVLPWTFFASAVTYTGQSVVANQDLVTKVYFPRLLLPLSAMIAALVDFLLGLVVLVALMLVHRRLPTASFFLGVPLLTLVLAVTAVGIGTFLAALTVAYRDVRHALPFLIQLWMLATPSIYMRELLTENPRWAAMLPLNPVEGLIFNFRVAALGTGDYNYYSLFVSGSLGVMALLFGSWYFRRVERSFADVI